MGFQEYKPARAFAGRKAFDPNVAMLSITGKKRPNLGITVGVVILEKMKWLDSDGELALPGWSLGIGDGADEGSIAIIAREEGGRKSARMNVGGTAANFALSSAAGVLIFKRAPGEDAVQVERMPRVQCDVECHTKNGENFIKLTLPPEWVLAQA